MNPDLEKNSSESPYPFGPERCVELTKGLERAAPESGSIVMARMFFWFIYIVPFLFIVLLIAFIAIPQFDNSDLSSPLSFFTIMVTYAFLLYGATWAIRHLTGGILNKLYYKSESLVNETASEGEKILASFLIKKPPFSYYTLHNDRSDHLNHLCVITTHRAVIIEVQCRLSGLASSFTDNKMKLLQTFDYSSPIDFYPVSQSTGFVGKYISARFGILAQGADKAEIWDFMPIDGNAWNLLEEILRRKSKIT